ncbi:MAG: nucleotidyl transferase AbiEii/AbiGii toxin family protein [Candidatus Omnitrophica bacterium]|nr:nucleotidyl transferase AbiEii/AbiGii toxin family protein [Candidatus Omnitrophota bacterium]
MEKESYNQLQVREVFHLEFLRCLGRKIKPENYALKGGVNLRLFFKSFRYSEDMDLDASGIIMDTLKETVMKILEAPSFQESLKTFGIERIIPPDISKAKQTETTQRFKIHLLTASGEDLFTKVEFSRRGFKGDIAVQPVLGTILRAYKLSPLLCPHYTAETAVFHKIEALALRSATQARDIFDLYILIPQARVIASPSAPSPSIIEKARENALEVSFEQFRDTVLSYLAPQDRGSYDKASVWDEIKLKVTEFIEKGKNNA